MALQGRRQSTNELEGPLPELKDLETGMLRSFVEARVRFSRAGCSRDEVFIRQHTFNTSTAVELRR